MSAMSTVLKMMTKNKETNKKIYKLYYGDAFPIEFIFDILVYKYKNNNYEDKKLLFIEALLDLGYDVNDWSYKYGYMFDIFQFSLRRDYSEKFLLDLFKLAIKYGKNVNFKDRDNIAVGPYLINNFNKNRKITSLYKLLVENGYDIFYTSYGFCNLVELIDTSDVDVPDKDEFIEEYTKDRKRLYKEKLDKFIDDLKNRYSNFNNISILHNIVERKYDEEITFETIKYLLDNDVNPNELNNDSVNFIGRAIELRHSEKYIYNLIDLGLKYHFNINHQDKYGQTIMINIIKHYKKEINIIPIFELLLSNGYIYNLKDNQEYTFYDYLIEDERSNIIDKEEFINKYSYLFNLTNEIIKNNVNDIERIGKLYNNADYDKKLVNIIDCEKYIKNRCNLIIGKEGSGKTTSLNYLANYLTSNNDKVFFTSAKDIINNCTSISMVKEILIDLIHKSIDYNMILFIDDFDKLYNFKNLKYLKEELNILLNYYIDKKKLNLVISINNCNKNKILDEALHEVTNIINVKEHTNEELDKIIDNIINSYDIDINNQYIDLLKQILLNIVKEENIINYNNISILKVVSEIINNTFIYKAKLDIESINYGFRTSKYLKDEIKDIIVNELNNLNNNYSEENIKKLVKNLIK